MPLVFRKAFSLRNWEKFQKLVEKKAQILGFDPTLVLNGPFASEKQKEFIRRITSGLFLEDKLLKGITLLDTSEVVTDERGCETIFGSYPDQPNDFNGKSLLEVRTKGVGFFMAS